MLKTTSFFGLAIASLISIFGLSAPESQAQGISADEQLSCRLSKRWRTVDLFNEMNVREAVPHALATIGNTVFSAGEAGGTRGGWVVRRSLDRGETWRTVDRYQRPDFSAESAGGIAIDSRTRHIYVAGGLSEESGNPAGWVVRKSIDNGFSWRTVDEVIGHNIARKITVDTRGVVYAVGAWDGAGGFLRRSIDGARTWRTIVYSTSGMNGYSVITAPNGRVFVGAIDGSYGWHIFTSANGLTRWEEVDYIPGVPSLEYGSPADAHITQDGHILFTGVMPLYGGIVRSAHFTRFRDWSNLVAFPSTRTVASTSTRDGKIFVTGLRPHPTDDKFAYYTTWLGRLGRAFVIHDSLQRSSQSFGSPTDLAYGAAAVTGSGDVLTTQFWTPSEDAPSDNNWIVRKLQCL